jgi:beta-glucosidase
MNFMQNRQQLISLFFVLFIFSLGAEHNFFKKNPGGVVYPTGFLKGVSFSFYQNGGHNYWKTLGYRPESNWTWFENEFQARFIIDRARKGGVSFGFCKSSPIDRGEKVGVSSDGWNRMFDDISLIKELNCNALCFDIPWTDVNPEKNVWNEEAFQLFDEYIDTLLKNNIEPILTLYHWVHPRWFHELGAWEKEENITYFVRYSQEVFKRFGHKVKYWCTINEPTVISVCGYVLGTHAPGKKDQASLLRPFAKDCFLSLFPHNYELAASVLGNLFKAHIETYEAIKTMPHGENAMVSIIHQMAQFTPHFKTLFEGGPILNPLSSLLAKYFNKIFGHKIFMDFFKTGCFKYDLPGGKSITFVDTRAMKSLDFIGLDFYADTLFGPAPECEYGELMTDMICWAVRPQSMYNAIKEVSSLGVPIIITENGICDAKDDRREKWIVGYSNAIAQAIADNYDVRGYCYWSLLDNFEWNIGHNKKFGLYAVDTLSDNLSHKNRTLRKGSEAYRDYVKVVGLS